MNKPITAECYRNRDAQDYLAECDHSAHELQHCMSGACQGFIVNWETWRSSLNFICETCKDSGYSNE